VIFGHHLPHEGYPLHLLPMMMIMMMRRTRRMLGPVQQADAVAEALSQGTKQDTQQR